MRELREFRLPDVGEGLTEADIVSWHVKPGDAVEVNQVIVEIETAKAIVELPSPYDGVVARLLAEEGQTVDVGTPIIAVDVGGTAPDAAGAAPAEPAGATSQDQIPERAPAPPQAQPASPSGEPAEPAGEPQQRQPVLVGYGVKPGSTTRRPRKAPAASGAAASAAPPPGGASPAAPPGAAPAAPPRGGVPARATAPPSVVLPAVEATPAPRIPALDTNGNGGAPAARSRALAKPPVRKLARDLGIDLASLAGTGPDGSITRDDVQRAAGETTVRSEEQRTERQPAAGTLREERIPVRGVRKHTAAAMVASAFTAPHVTEFLQADVTEMMAAARRVRELPEYGGLRVSPLLFVARALLAAAARHPMINSSWDEAAQEIVVHRGVNLGIAVATDRGLIVPNVKDAGALPMAALARALDELAATARAGKSTPADLSGGTITITNVGVFGVDAGTPILTPGEAAILAFGQVRDAPWVHDGQLAVRKVTTLSLSFDHRIVDGELGSRVLRDVGSMLEDPIRMLAWS